MRSSNSLAFGRALIATNLKAALALRGAFVVQVVFMALNNFTFFVFWWALMGRVTTLRGWQLWGWSFETKPRTESLRKNQLRNPTIPSSQVAA